MEMSTSNLKMFIDDVLSTVTCPVCGTEHMKLGIIRVQLAGKNEFEDALYLGCKAYPKCTVRIWLRKKDVKSVVFEYSNLYKKSRF
jgi:ssDNA-binding Zn-finger/Zn-ribbon topoisomerase 1